MEENKNIKRIMVLLAAAIMCMSILGFITTVSANGTDDCPPGMVAYWKLDETSPGLAIDSYNSYDGTNNGPATENQPGKVDTSYYFDGNDNIDCGDITELNGVSEFTIEGWIKHDNNMFNDRVFHKWNGHGHDISIAPYGGRIYFEIGNPSNTYGYWNDYASSIPSNTWYHLAAVFDGGLTGNANRAKIYVNAIQRTMSFSGTIPATTSPLLSSIPFTLSYSSDTFNGYMDDVAIYNRALSPSEIMAQYNNGLAGHEICYVPIINDNCLLIPDNLGDATLETIGTSGEPTLQSIIDGKFGNGIINVLTDQTQYQIFQFNDSVECIEFEIEYIVGYAGATNTFGYYFGTTPGSCTGLSLNPIFTDPPDGPGIYPPITITNDMISYIGFYLDTSHQGGVTLYTENSCNSVSIPSNPSGQRDYALIFEVPDGSMGAGSLVEYVVAWEDPIDFDYNDVVVIVRVKADDTTPSTVKTIGDPQCNNGQYVTTATDITLTATDGGLCPGGVKEIHYIINGDETIVPGDTVTFTFDEECEHELEFWAVDNCDNEEQHTIQTHNVDDTPPTTIKTIGDPQCDNGHYVTTTTDITLDATDDKSGVTEIHYIINGVETIVYGDEVTFSFDEECEHVLEFWAVDCLGNEEQHTIQTHYVDDTPPTTIKTIGIPQYLGGQYVTTSTPIILTATDGGPICHSGVTEIHYIINGIETIVYGDEVTFTFEEECTHVLEFWAVDCLGNEEQHTIQTHYVDDTPPTLTKTYPDHGYYQGYMKCGAEIILEAVDEGLCISGLDGIYYRTWFNGLWSSWYTYSGPISFDEECIHGLEYYAIDNLGNIAEFYQEYYVDCTPPTITKTHPPDYVLIDPDPIMTGWIKAGSIITLDAIDGGTPPCIAGVENIFWRYEYDGDNYPESGDPGSIDGADLATLYGYTDPEIIDYIWYYEPDTVGISFTDLGEHDLFYWSKDNVCNNEGIHHQIYWVNECQPEVWVDDNFHTETSDWWITKFSEIQIALDWLEPGGIAHVYKGIYRGDFLIDDVPWCDNTGITIEGIYGCPPLPMTQSAIIEGTFTIKVDGVTINNFVFEPNTDAAVTVEANIVNTVLRCNIFLMNCVTDSIGVDAQGGSEVDARENYWGAPDGPNGGIMEDGAINEGFGVQVIGNVYVEPFVGAHAEAIASSYSVDVGTPVTFNAEGSFAADFGSTYEPSYYWTFEPLYHSIDKQPSYVFSSPGTYMVSLRVQGNGINGLHDNFMFDWTYLSIEVDNPTSSLSANAGGSGLGIYVTYIDEPLTFQGSASGGTPPYSYSWNLGDGSSSNEQNPSHTYSTVDVYTVSLTVTDSFGDTAIDTVIVEVYEIGELVVSIGGPYNTNVEVPVNFNSYVSGGLGPYTYSWNFGDDTKSIDTNPTHIYESEGTYIVTLTVIDSRDNEDTVTTTVTVETTEEVVEITEVIGGFGIKATIKADDTQTDWTISVDGLVIMGHDASGIIPAGSAETVKIPFTIAFGKVDITVTAGWQEETYTAFALGPLFLNIQEK